MYKYINNTILACNRYLPKRKKEKKKEGSIVSLHVQFVHEA